LAGENPVTQLEVDCSLALSGRLQLFRDEALALGGIHAVVLAGVHHGADVREGELYFLSFLRGNNLDDGDLELGGKFMVPLVMGGYCHDGSGAVTHEHVVGDPHRNFLAVDGVDAVGACGYTALFLGEVGSVEVALECGLADVVLDRVLILRGGDLLNDRVLGRDDHVGGAEKGVGAGGVYVEGLAIGAVDLELNLGSLGAADPGSLLSLCGVGPVEPVQAL
jgi:hypothetical protein